MKTLILVLLIVIVPFGMYAQTDSTQIISNEFDELIYNVQPKDTVETKKEEVKKSGKDTLQVRVGKHNVEIITDDENTYIDVEKIEDFKSKWDRNDWNGEKIKTVHHRHHRRDFDGHWAGLDFGGNQLWDTDYSMYSDDTPAFLETSPEKSFEFNLNFAEYSFGFGSYIGFVTGLGLNFNDYKFKNRYTITKDEDGIIQPVELEEGDFRKSKLSTVYLTAPLLLEIQIPGNHGNDRMFITAGVIGGLKIGEHTKTKIGSEKSKDRGDHNISPLRWGYTARVGFEDVGIYATYYNVGLFEEGTGPATTPVTVGLTFTFD